MANMNIEQRVTANGNGVVINTRITCGLLYQSEHVIPFAVIGSAPDADSFLESAKLCEVHKVFSQAWGHVGG